MLEGLPGPRCSARCWRTCKAPGTAYTVPSSSVMLATEQQVSMSQALNTMPYAAPYGTAAPNSLSSGLSLTSLLGVPGPQTNFAALAKSSAPRGIKRKQARNNSTRPGGWLRQQGARPCHAARAPRSALQHRKGFDPSRWLAGQPQQRRKRSQHKRPRQQGVFAPQTVPRAPYNSTTYLLEHGGKPNWFVTTSGTALALLFKGLRTQTSPTAAGLILAVHVCRCHSCPRGLSSRAQAASPSKPKSGWWPDW